MPPAMGSGITPTYRRRYGPVRMPGPRSTVSSAAAVNAGQDGLSDRLLDDSAPLPLFAQLGGTPDAGVVPGLTTGQTRTAAVSTRPRTRWGLRCHGGCSGSLVPAGPGRTVTVSLERCAQCGS